MAEFNEEKFAALLATELRGGAKVRHAGNRPGSDEVNYPQLWELDGKHIVATEDEAVKRGRSWFDVDMGIGARSAAANEITRTRILSDAATIGHLADLKTVENVFGLWTDRAANIDEVSRLASVPSVEAIAAMLARAVGTALKNMDEEPEVTETTEVTEVTETTEEEVQE